jgi:hypothetical protein
VLTSAASKERSKEGNGLKKNPWKNFESESAKTQWLSEDDINLIASRFELGNRIDVKVFFDFFQDSDEKLANGSLSCDPFKYSEEWSTLRRSAKHHLSNHGDHSHPGFYSDSTPESQLSSTDDEDVPKGTRLLLNSASLATVRSKWDVARNARKQLQVINAMKGSPKAKNDLRPPLSKQPSGPWQCLPRNDLR